MQVSTSAPAPTFAVNAAPGTAGDASTSTDGSGASGGVLAQMKQLAGMLSDSSTASQIDKVNAYINLYRLKVTTPAAAWATLSPADQNAINDAFTDSQTAQAVKMAGQAFHDKAMSMAGDYETTNIGGVMLDDFNSLSPLDQLMTYAGTFSAAQYTFDQAKQQLQQNADYYARATGPSVSVTLSPSAQAALNPQASGASPSSGSSPTDGATQALDTLTASSPRMSQADIGLAMLQQASDAQAKAANDQKSSSNTADAVAPSIADAQKPYSAGDAVDTTV